jgi:hypothetical protein
MKIVPGDGKLNYHGVRWEEADTHKTQTSYLSMVSSNMIVLHGLKVTDNTQEQVVIKEPTN